MATAGGAYTFQAAPRAARPKYRQQQQSEGGDASKAPAANIMYDARVVRGSTYAIRRQAALQLQKQQQQMLEEQQRLQRSRARSGGSRRSGAGSSSPGPASPSAADQHAAIAAGPAPVEGRTHAEAQTTRFLERLVDRPPELETSTQTEMSLDRPVSPLFVPRPSGESKSTSIGEGDLFDFDLEVEPVLEVLVGRSLDYGLMEVLEEEELRALQRHRAEFEQARNAATAVNQRLEAAERRRVEEKERRVLEAQERVRAQRVEERNAAARTEAKRLLQLLCDGALQRLERDGHFYDPVDREVREGFVPWLADAVSGDVAARTLARRLLDQMIRDASSRLDVLRAAQLDERARLRQAEAERRAAAEAEASRLAAEAAAKRKAEREARRLAEEAEGDEEE